MGTKRKLVSKKTLAAAQQEARRVHPEEEYRDEAVRAALEVAAPLIAKQVLRDHIDSHRILGRVIWDSKHRSNWMLFPGITAYREWSKEMRIARPEVTTEYAYLSTPGPENVLASARAEAEYRRKVALEELI
jgi:hypothetical protein